jgi:hypothetical protein
MTFGNGSKVLYAKVMAHVVFARRESGKHIPTDRIQFTNFRIPLHTSTQWILAMTANTHCGVLSSARVEDAIRVLAPIMKHLP